MLLLGAISKRLGRPVLGLVVAYAVAAQSLFIAFGGFALAAPADVGAPGFELCLHDGQTAPDSSGNTPSHPGCTHCIFCFAGSHHAVIGAAPVLSQRIDVETTVVPWLAAQDRQRPLPAYSIANPRGPPNGV
jgi:hypothetical protein